MEKYATYIVYRNVHTKEIKRIPIDAPLEKLASVDWEELAYDPEEEETTNESKG
jgi:hypothetical protein